MRRHVRARPPTLSPPIQTTLGEPEVPSPSPASSAPYIHKVSLSDDEDEVPEAASPVPDFSPQEQEPFVALQGDEDATTADYEDPLARLERDTNDLACPEPLGQDAPVQPDAPQPAPQTSDDPTCKGPLRERHPMPVATTTQRPRRPPERRRDKRESSWSDCARPAPRPVQSSVQSGPSLRS